MSYWSRRAGILPDERPPGIHPGERINISPSSPWWKYSSPVATQPVPAQPQEPQHDFSKAMHLKRSSNCPQCGSGDYMTLGQVSSRSGSFEHKRCFACGYPAVQSMSGMASISNKPGQPTKQVSMMNITNDQGRILGSTQAASGTASTYNPTDVRAGRIG